MRRFVIVAGLVGLLGAGLWTTRSPVMLPPTSPDQPALTPFAPTATGQPGPVDAPQQVGTTPPPVVIDAQRPPASARATAPKQDALVAPIAPLPLAPRTAAAPSLGGQPVSRPETKSDQPTAPTASAAADPRPDLPTRAEPARTDARPTARVMVPPKNGDIPGREAPVSRSAVDAALPEGSSKPAKSAAKPVAAPSTARLAVRSRPVAKRAVATARKAQKTAEAAYLAPTPRIAPAPRMAPVARIVYRPL